MFECEICSLLSSPVSNKIIGNKRRAYRVQLIAKLFVKKNVSEDSIMRIFLEQENPSLKREKYVAFRLFNFIFGRLSVKGYADPDLTSGTSECISLLP